MINPLITIITAAWRLSGLKNVLSCLEKQTYRNFDHIIVNDNNEEIRQWLKDNNYFIGNDKVHIVDNYTRCHTYGGVARNIGITMAFSYIRECKRDYDNEMITFLDDDNLWENNHLELMVNKLKDNDIVFSDARWVGVNDINWSEIREFKYHQGGFDLGQGLYKRKLFTELGYFNPRPSRKQRFDYEIISKFIDSGCKVEYTHKPTFIMSYRKK